MKVLTIKQPWATLIMQQDKRFEFRSWQTKYRGEVLIHAGLSVDKKAMERLKKYLPKDIPMGKILGKVTLSDCIEVNDDLRIKLSRENSDIYTNHSFEDKYAWKVDNVEVFGKPIEVKGKLGLWNFEI